MSVSNLDISRQDSRPRRAFCISRIPRRYRQGNTVNQTFPAVKKELSIGRLDRIDDCTSCLEWLIQFQNALTRHRYLSSPLLYKCQEKWSSPWHSSASGVILLKTKTHILINYLPFPDRNAMPPFYLDLHWNQHQLLIFTLSRLFCLSCISLASPIQSTAQLALSFELWAADSW